MRQEKEFRRYKVQNLLLAGDTLNRKSIGDFGVGINNYSLHSDISVLRNDKYIPIESKRLSDQTCDYFMKSEEILRYKDPFQRALQENEMRLFVKAKRELRANKYLLSVSNQVDITSNIRQALSQQAIKDLKKLVRDINALLERQGAITD